MPGLGTGRVDCRMDPRNHSEHRCLPAPMVRSPRCRALCGASLSPCTNRGRRSGCGCFPDRAQPATPPASSPGTIPTPRRPRRGGGGAKVGPRPSSFSYHARPGSNSDTRDCMVCASIFNMPSSSSLTRHGVEHRQPCGEGIQYISAAERAISCQPAPSSPPMAGPTLQERVQLSAPAVTLTSSMVSPRASSRQRKATSAPISSGSMRRPCGMLPRIGTRNPSTVRSSACSAI